ncbi:macro domain-containing protein [Candidatus Babeliales bacterium]|nr:macro domain-containing protein [Candidatus Babeliales bacterium]
MIQNIKKLTLSGLLVLMLGMYQCALANFVMSIPEIQLQIVVEKGDITKSNVDIIVNAANQELEGGGGVCGAIFTAAGWDKLQQACNAYLAQKAVRCPTGQARITDSFDLKKQGIKHIIHAVGPDCRIIKNHGLQDTLLNNSYQNSLKLAETVSATSIAFPFISSAIYAFPKDRAAYIAVQSVYQYLKEHKQSHLKSVHFVLFSQDDFDLFCKTITHVAQGKNNSYNQNSFWFTRCLQFLKSLVRR